MRLRRGAGEAIVLAGVLAWAVWARAADEAPGAARGPERTSAECGTAAAAGGEEKGEATEVVDAEVDRVLRRCEKAGEEVERLEANFDYDYNQTLIDEHEWRTGRVRYRKPNKIHIEFTDKGKERFRFDGRVYVEDRPGQKQRYVYRLRKDAEPEITDLDIDKVPFPLPFGQKRDKVLKAFDVTYGGKKKLERWGRPGEKAGEAQGQDAKEYEHLELRPKAKTAMSRDYRKIEFWVDPEDGLPRQIRMEDTSERILTVRFRDTKTNEKAEVNDKMFEEGELPAKWERNYSDQTAEKARPSP